MKGEEEGRKTGTCEVEDRRKEEEEMKKERRGGEDMRREGRLRERK